MAGDEQRGDAPPNVWAGETVLAPPNGSHAFEACHTVFGAPPPEAFEAPGAFEAGHTVFGAPPPEAFEAPGAFGPGHTVLGAPPPDAFAAAAPEGAHAQRELARAKQLHAEGVRLGQMRHFAQADPKLRESLDLRRRYLPPGDVLVANGCVSLGTLYFFGGRPDLAEPLYREAWSLYRRGVGDLHPDTATRAVELARVLTPLGRAHEAYGLLRGAHDVYVATVGPAHPATLGVLELLRSAFLR